MGAGAVGDEVALAQALTDLGGVTEHEPQRGRRRAPNAVTNSISSQIPTAGIADGNMVSVKPSNTGAFTSFELATAALLRSPPNPSGFTELGRRRPLPGRAV